MKAREKVESGEAAAALTVRSHGRVTDDLPVRGADTAHGTQCKDAIFGEGSALQYSDKQNKNITIFSAPNEGIPVVA